MVYKCGVSPTLMFSVNGSRYRCNNGSFDDSGVEQEVKDFLKASPLFEPVSAPKKKTEKKAEDKDSAE